jgi:hypothetical protein
MNIPWKFKSFIFDIIDFLSLYKLLYHLQKYITRHSRVEIKQLNRSWLIHKESLSKFESSIVIEFGAGKSLAQNIFLSPYGYSQTVVDLFPMIDLSMVRDAANQISKITNQQVYPIELISDLKKNYNIHYLAPFDLCKSNFHADSFDACISTATLEHIPRDSIIDIFKELQRIIVHNGIISAVIDYSDHYAYTDNSISKLNFLKFSENEFCKYNHKSHYQNRLRHDDYEDIFESLGFEILTSEALEKKEPPHFIANEFKNRCDSVLATLGVFLLRVKK